MFRQSVIHSTWNGENTVSEVVSDLQAYNAEGGHKSTYYFSYITTKGLKLSFSILCSPLGCSNKKLDVLK